MIEHDAGIGKILGKLDELGIADNTIVYCWRDAEGGREDEQDDSFFDRNRLSIQSAYR